MAQFPRFSCDPPNPRVSGSHPFQHVARVHRWGTNANHVPEPSFLLPTPPLTSHPPRHPYLVKLRQILDGPLDLSSGARRGSYHHAHHLRLPSTRSDNCVTTRRSMPMPYAPTNDCIHQDSANAVGSPRRVVSGVPCGHNLANHYPSQQTPAWFPTLALSYHR